MLKSVYLLLILLALTPFALMQADSASPLLDMLALVPDNTTSRGAIVSYVDYRAMERARGLETPAAGSDALLNATWMAVLRGVSSGMQWDTMVMSPEDTAQAVGFSFLDMDRSLVFGSPPGTGTILAGDFDLDSIGAAYTAAEYVASDVDGVTVYCGEAGCDAGMQINLQNRSPANPFGGNLGRQEPLALLPDLLANSPDWNVLQSMINTFHGEQNSLADAPDYRAVALAAAEQGSVNQIQFVNPQELIALDPAALMRDADSVARLRESTSGFEPLPLYALAAIADVWDGSDQRALILLAYADQATAQAAADELARRMDAFVPFSTGVPFSERLANISGALDTPAVYTDPESAVSVAVWSLRYPMPPNALERGEQPVISSMGFRFLIDSLYRRDLYVLALEPGMGE